MACGDSSDGESTFTLVLKDEGELNQTAQLIDDSKSMYKDCTGEGKFDWLGFTFRFQWLMFNL